MRKIDWSERAILDFEAAIGFIKKDNPQNAVLVADRIFKSLKILETFSLGSPGPNGSYKLFIPKTSYFVLFRRNEDGDISLRAFLHTSQDWGNVDWDKII